MADDSDTMKPLTRGELREELASLEQRMITSFEERMDARMDAQEHRMTTAFEQRMDERDGRLVAVMQKAFAESDRRMQQAFADRDRQMIVAIADSEQRVTAAIQASEQRTHAELARHVATLESSFRTQISVVDDKYSDIPRQIAANDKQQAEHELRLGRLETAVFPPTPPRKRARRRG